MRSIRIGALSAAVLLVGAQAVLAQDAEKPNIVVIWGDDIGRDNISVWSKGLMGYQTPNIDRVAAEGVTFTDYYAEQSCTAGRSAFITGQAVFRTGLSKVGMPGAPQGMQAEDPTMATLLKEQGYATGQFGKNHLGDRNEHLPTVHGFDEFYGNLYHLNAEEEPENIDYPRDLVLKDGRTFLEAFGPRGVLDCVATEEDSSAEPDPRFGEWGRQECEDTGPLTRERMKTIDDDIAARAVDFIERKAGEDEPFFVWVNFTHMHFRTHIPEDQLGQAGRAQSIYHDAMVKHDGNVGTVLDKLDELGLADNTIVMYSTDNGPHKNTWPDAATSAFRNEKNSGWEGAFRVPAFVRWPGVIEPGTISNEIVSHLDWVPTFLAAAGVEDIAGQLREGYTANGQEYRVHLDGYDLTAHLSGEAQSPRDRYFYFSDEGDLIALRVGNWKAHFMVQDAPGTLEVWQREFRSLRMPYIFNLRTDPYEQATITSNTYWDWMIDRAWALYPLGPIVGEFLATFEEFPPRQKAGSFTVENALEAITSSVQK